MKYEYKIQPVSVGDDGDRPDDSLGHDEGILNQFGKEGWELVSVLESPIQYAAVGRSLLYFLKRPIP